MSRRVLGMTAGVLAALAAACGPLPGTSQCQVGRAEHLILCQDICRDAAEARSSTERDDIRECAERDCDLQCE